MAQNNEQIFSLKSNLITQFKGVSMNLNQNKNNQHSRLKSFCFSNVLRTIRNDVAKFRVKEPEKDTIQNKDKENKGMIIEACNFKNAYVQDTSIVTQPTKSGILHSRSFLIRSFHNKRLESMSSEPKQGQSQPKIHMQCTTFDITLKHYKLESLRELKQQVNIKQRKCPPTIKPLLSILIPIEMVRASKGQMEVLSKQLMQKNIDIYILSQRQKYKQLQQYQQYCNIMVVKSDTYSRTKDYHREVVLDFNEQVLSRTGSNILVLCGPDVNNKSSFYIPFCTKFRQSTQYQEHVSMQVKLCYFGLSNPNLIKTVDITHDTIIHLSLNHLHSKKLQIVEQHYPLQQEIGLQLSNKQRQQRNSQKSQVPPSGQQIQEKLMEYSKIIKKQQQGNQSTSTSMEIKSKGARGSLTSKTAYQLVYELMKNNTNICKQINKYIETCGNLCMADVFVDCDDILYYLLV